MTDWKSMQIDSELDVFIYMWGDRLSSENVGSLSNLPLRSMRLKGQEIKDGVLASTGMLAFNTSAYVSGNPISEHLRFVCANLSDIILNSRNNLMVEKVRIQIMVSARFDTIEDSSWSDEIESDTLGKIAAHRSSFSTAFSAD